MNRNIKNVLWENLLRLMVNRYGKENLSRLNKEAKEAGIKIGLGNLSRIKEQETSVGLDLIENLATFFNLFPWQILMPNLDPTNPPVFAMTETEKKLYEKMKRLRKQIAELEEQ